MAGGAFAAPPRFKWLGKVEAVQVHHLVPDADKVMDKFLRRIVARKNFGEGAELGVGAEHQINAGGGPFHRAGLGIQTVINAFCAGFLPFGVAVEQVGEEIRRQRAWPGAVSFN